MTRQLRDVETSIASRAAAHDALLQSERDASRQAARDAATRIAELEARLESMSDETALLAAQLRDAERHVEAMRVRGADDAALADAQLAQCERRIVEQMTRADVAERDANRWQQSALEATTRERTLSASLAALQQRAATVDAEHATLVDAFEAMRGQLAAIEISVARSERTDAHLEVNKKTIGKTDSAKCMLVDKFFVRNV